MAGVRTPSRSRSPTSSTSRPSRSACCRRSTGRRGDSSASASSTWPSPPASMPASPRRLSPWGDCGRAIGDLAPWIARVQSLRRRIRLRSPASSNRFHGGRMDPVIPDDEAGPAPSVIVLDHVSKRFTDFVAVHDADFAIASGRVLLDAGSVRLRQDHHAADDRRASRPPRGPDPPRGRGRVADAALQAQREHGVPAVRPVPPHERSFDNVAFGLRSQASSRRLGQRVGRARCSRSSRMSRVRQAPAQPALRRPAAARRARPRAGEQAVGAPARRAARRPRPQAPPGDAARAQADPARRGRSRSSS